MHFEDDRRFYRFDIGEYETRSNNTIQLTMMWQYTVYNMYII